MKLKRLQYIFEGLQKNIQCIHCNKNLKKEDFDLMQYSDNIGLFLSLCPFCNKKTYIKFDIFQVSEKININMYNQGDKINQNDINNLKMSLKNNIFINKFKNDR